MLNESRQAGVPFQIVVTDEMIDAGIEALASFQEGDGSTLSEKVVEIYLHMFSHRPRDDL